jgi:DUF4097 and DUF4098 domain-containing protein YvlB
MAKGQLVLSAPLFFIGALTLAGCGTLGLTNPFKSEETVAKSFAVRPAPEVVVSTFNGKIEVTTHDKAEVRAKIVKSAGGSSKEAAAEDLENIEVTMAQEGNEIQILAKSVGQKLITNRAAHVELQVPPGTTLDLQTSNGAVSAVGPVGPVRAETSNGPIDITESKGPLSLGTSNGAITVEGGTDKIAVSARTSNGAIDFAGELAEGKQSFETSNGRIRIALPAGANFRVKADTSNGKISCDFPLENKVANPKTHLSGSVGSDPAIDLFLNSSNGSIEILEQK